MKTRTQTLVALLIALLGVFACASGSAAPEILVSLAGVGDGVVTQGEPLRVTVRLTVPRDTTSPLVIAPAQGTWVDAISVELVSPENGAMVARATANGNPAQSSATLDADRIAGGLWRFSSAAMQSVPPGNYLVRARLSVTSGTGWQGQLESEPAELSVVPAAADPVQRAVNVAYDAILDGKTESGGATLDAALKEFPDNTRLLLARADVALAAGNWLAASVCMKRIRQVSPVSAAGPPPVAWLEMELRIEAAREAAPASAKPPERSWPRPVMEAYSAAVVVEATKQAAAQGAAAGPAPPAAPTPAPAPTPTAPDPPPVSLKPSGGTPSDGTLVPSTELDEAKILADANGQWATGASAGSQYSSPNYAAAKLTGPPDVPSPGDNINAWCHGSASAESDWIELTYAKPVHATEIRVRQTNCPGTIARVEAIEPDGTVHLWWAGADPFKATYQNTLAWFAVRVPKTDYLVAKVKITLNLAAVPGWKQVDAVQLVGVSE